MRQPWRVGAVGEEYREIGAGASPVGVPGVVSAPAAGKVLAVPAARSVRAQVQGDELRVSAKKKDDLQEVISLLKGKEFDLALQFVNYR